MNTRSSCKLFNPSPLSKKRLFAHHHYACLCKKSLSHLVHMKNFGKSHCPGSRSDMACHTQRQWIHPDFKLRKCFMKLIQPFLCLLAVSCVSCIQIQIFFTAYIVYLSSSIILYTFPGAASTPQPYTVLPVHRTRHLSGNNTALLPYLLPRSWPETPLHMHAGHKPQ